MKTRKGNYVSVNTEKKKKKAPVKQTLQSHPVKKVAHQAIPTQSSKEKDQTIDKQLTEIYENIKSTPSYSAKINEFLRKNNVHSTHKRIIKKKFPRRRIIARVPFEIMQADLFEYPMYKYQNRHYVYALVLIDCFSRKLWAVPMKHKTDNVTAQAFESIFSKLDNVPVHIVTDGGKGKIII